MSTTGRRHTAGEWRELTLSFSHLNLGSAIYSPGLNLDHCLFLLMNFYCDTATLVHLCINYGSFYINNGRGQLLQQRPYGLQRLKYSQFFL